MKRNALLHTPLYWKRALAALGTVALFGAVLLSGIVRCPSALLFHVPCPTCGGTRAVRALLSFDPAAALRFNPLAPLVALLVTLLAARGVLLVARDGDARRLLDGAGRALAKGLAVVLVAEVVVWALRFFGLFGGPCPV